MDRRLFILIISSIVSSVQGMDCTLGQSTNIFEKFAKSCPGLLDDPNNSYCCFDVSSETVRCCNAQEFAITTARTIILPALGAVVVVVLFIIFCISCLCCSCCPWYRRRHRGTVYGRVQGPSVIQVIQTPGVAQPPPQASHNAYAYPASQIAMPDHGPAPPQYTAEAYVKQAAYNPTYAQ